MEASLWERMFDTASPQAGCPEEQIEELLDAISRPLNAEESDYLNSIVRRNPFPAGTPEHASYVPPDPRQWPWPAPRLPASYLSFLRWSNGGTFSNEQRQIELFEASWIRNVMLCNLFPLGAPLVVPFAAVPGAGDWYGFDTSREAVADELPVVYIPHGGSMSEPMVLAPTFPTFCQGTDQPDTAAYWTWWEHHHRSPTVNRAKSSYS